MIDLKYFITTESILDDFDTVDVAADKVMIGDWFKENVKGKYKTVILKDGTVKVWGDIVIKDYKENSFPVTISSMEGNVVIEKCPNITSINGLFVDPTRINGSLAINNCQKLTTLEGCPWIVNGSFSLTGNSSLKSLEGMPNFISGTIYVMKNGKKFTKEQIEKYVKVPHRIVCSVEDEDMLIEGLINEALNEPHLLELVDRMTACKMNPKKLLFDKFRVEWDKLDFSNITEYDEVNNKALTACRNMLSGRSGNTGIILLRDYNDEYSYIITSKKELMALNPDNNPDHFKYSGFWVPSASMVLIALIEKASSVVIIAWDAATGSQAIQKHNDRVKSRDGMVINSPLYYEKVAQENRERYKKLLIQNRANNQDKEFEKIDKDIDDILVKVMQVTRDLRKNFNGQNSNNIFDLLKIDELNRHIYDQEVWTGNSVSRGEDGLLLLYNRFTTYSLKAKRDGSAFAEREAKHYKSELLNKIKYLKSELGI